MSPKLVVLTLVAVVLVVAFVAMIAWGSVAPTVVSPGGSAIVGVIGGILIGYQIGKARGAR
ncbi:MAG: hypothetical protein IT352_07410 [Gemmatimonadales bacterium]|nr:hypothetical protein [Gemmatimonadales bacterium]